MDFMKRGVMASVAMFLILALATPDELRAARDAQADEKIKAKVVKVGVGEKVKVKLHAGRDIKGQLSEVRDSDFVVIDKDTAQARTVTYSMVKDIDPGYGIVSVTKSRCGSELYLWVPSRLCWRFVKATGVPAARANLLLRDSSSQLSTPFDPNE